MVRAFVFVDVTPGAAEKLQAILSGAETVREAHVVAGDHDVVVEIEADTVYDLLSSVTEEIRPVDGVEGTRTYVSLQ